MTRFVGLVASLTLLLSVGVLAPGFSAAPPMAPVTQQPALAPEVQVAPVLVTNVESELATAPEEAVIAPRARMVPVIEVQEASALVVVASASEMPVFAPNDDWYGDDDDSDELLEDTLDRIEDAFDDAADDFEEDLEDQLEAAEDALDDVEDSVEMALERVVEDFEDSFDNDLDGLEDILDRIEDRADEHFETSGSDRQEETWERDIEAWEDRIEDLEDMFEGQLEMAEERVGYEMELLIDGDLEMQIEDGLTSLEYLHDDYEARLKMHSYDLMSKAEGLYDEGLLTREESLKLRDEARRLAEQALPSEEELARVRAEAEQLASEVAAPDEVKLQEMAAALRVELEDWQQRYRQEFQVLNDELEVLAREHDAR